MSINGITADQSTRNSIAEKERDWFAPERKSHPEKSIKRCKLGLFPH
jgi:hypothetical protein